MTANGVTMESRKFVTYLFYFTCRFGLQAWEAVTPVQDTQLLAHEFNDMD
jgi:hypothetical protein